MSANSMKDSDILDRNIELMSKTLNQILHEEQESMVPTTFEVAFQVSEITKQQMQFGILPRNPYYDAGDIELKSVPLIAKSGGVDKVRNGTTKRHQKKTKTKKDYDKIVVDMSLLGFLNNCFERKPIVRIIELFRKMYYYLQDSLDEDPDFTDNINRTLNIVSMPQTLNLQTQLKNAEVQCITFLCEMQSLLYHDDTVTNNDLFTTCIFSIEKMNNMIVALSRFEHCNLEHHDGEWTCSSRVFGEHLEVFLHQLNDQIRETHIHVHIYSWDQRSTKAQLIEEKQNTVSAVTSTTDDNFSFSSQQQTIISHEGSEKQTNMTTKSALLPLIVDDGKYALSLNQNQWSNISENGRGNTKRGFLRYIGTK